MKKWLIAAVIFVIIIMVAVTVFAVIKLAPLGSKEEAVSEGILSPESYAREHYPDYNVIYDAGQKLLILEKKTDFSMSSASSIYADDDTYTVQVRILALDILDACGDPEIEVLLRYLSKDGEPMYSVSSLGPIVRYWEKDKAA